MSNSKKARVLIVGDGFGRLYTALYFDKPLASGANVEVTTRQSGNIGSVSQIALVTPQ